MHATTLQHLRARTLVHRTLSVHSRTRASAKFVCLFVYLFVYLFILGRKPNRQNCLLKEVLREREEKKRKKRRKVIRL